MASVSLNEWVSEAIQARLETAFAVPAFAGMTWDTALQGKLNQYVAATASEPAETRANENGMNAPDERYADAA